MARKRASRTRARAAVAAVVLALAFAVVGWNSLFRVDPVPFDAPAAAFQQGTPGVEDGRGIPYWIWVVLPRVFPEHLPGPGGYAALGFAWEEGEELPVGFSRSTGRFPRVAGPATPGDAEAYRRFLARVARDPRFTAENLMPEIEYLTPLSAAERMVYRTVLIPRTRSALLRTAAASGAESRSR